MSDLRTRIAKAMTDTIAEYAYCEELGTRTVVDGQIDFLDVADAVIRELETHYQLVPKSELYLKLFSVWKENDETD